VALAEFVSSGEGMPDSRLQYLNKPAVAVWMPIPPAVCVLWPFCGWSPGVRFLSPCAWENHVFLRAWFYWVGMFVS